MATENKFTHSDLLLRISELKAEKTREETTLRISFNAFVASLNPVTIVKNSLHELAMDSEVHTSVAKMGLNLGANYIINGVLGKHRSFKNFLNTLLIEKFSTSIIYNNLSKILSYL